MTLAILGLGTALPTAAITQADGLRVAQALIRPTGEQATWLPTMYAGTGVAGRRMALGEDVVRDIIDGTRRTSSPFLPRGEPGDRGPTTAERMRLYAELAPPLAVQAAAAALRPSGVQAADVTHLITVSCTGFVAPGVDLALIRALDLAPTVQRVHIGYMGCHGALNGLRVARAFTAAEPDARVLLCAVELCGLHYYYGWDAAKVIANALFADGGAAVVGAPVAAAPAAAWRVEASGSRLIPDSADAMTWTIGDHGFEMTLSKQVPRLIAAHLRPWLEAWLARHGVELDGVASWAVHPGGPRILDAVEEGLNLPRSALEPSRAVLRELGNMSSPTVLFILDRLRAAGAPRPCIALGFGPGLMAEAALLR
ncbi:MAG TPA: type III polyketide synthase [Gemmataceae bacterium]|nr:type III polyketide synthase [Gemmataceae bacterium]